MRIKRLKILTIIICLGTISVEAQLNKLDPLTKASDFLEKERKETRALIDSMVNNTPSYFLVDSIIPVTANEIKNLQLQDLVGADLSYKNLSNIDLSGKDLRFASFIGANLSGAKFDNSNLEGAILEGANLSNASFKSADLSNTFATGAIAKNIVLDSATIREAYWPYVLFENGSLFKTNIIKANFSGAEFTNTRLTDVKIDSCIFWGSAFIETVIRDSKVNQSNFTASIFDKTYFNKSQFFKCTFKDLLHNENIALETKITNCYFGKQYSDIYNLNLASRHWIDELIKFSMGFTKVDGYTIYYPKTNSILFDNKSVQEIYYVSLLNHLKSIATSIRYWDIVNSLVKILNDFKSLSEALRRSNSWKDRMLTVYANYKGDFVPFQGNIEDLVKEGLKQSIIKRNRAARRGTPEESEPEDLEEIFADNPLTFEKYNNIEAAFGGNLINAIKYEAFSRSFEPEIFNNGTPLVQTLNTEYFFEAIELVNDRQNIIINAMLSIGEELDISSFYRAQSRRSPRINHAIGSIDLSLRKTGLIDNPERKRQISEDLSKELGSEYLVILEEFYDIDAETTVHTATSEQRSNGRTNFNTYRPSENPPRNPSYSSEFPSSSDHRIIQINTYYRDGVFIRNTWGKPNASAQHIHIQGNKPEKNLPAWLRKSLNKRWLYQHNNILKSFNDSIPKSISSFYPRILYSEEKKQNNDPIDSNLTRRDLLDHIKENIDTSVVISIKDSVLFINNTKIHKQITVDEINEILGASIKHNSVYSYLYQGINIWYNENRTIDTIEFQFTDPGIENYSLKYPGLFLFNQINLTSSSNIPEKLLTLGLTPLPPQNIINYDGTIGGVLDEHISKYRLQLNGMSFYIEYDNEQKYTSVSISF